jgi:glutamate N-acetyltransferase/amino-acid N-acetyltransferase
MPLSLKVIYYLCQCLSEIVEESYNSISVDGDESNSDTFVCLASNQIPLTSTDDWKEALWQICQGLAAHIVRNGEGTGHVMHVSISN